MLYRAEGKAVTDLLAPIWRHTKRGSNDTAKDFQWAKTTQFYQEELVGKFVELVKQVAKVELMVGALKVPAELIA